MNSSHKPVEKGYLTLFIATVNCVIVNLFAICINLLKSCCLPSILYACETLCPNNRNMVMLNKAIDSAAISY